MFTKKGTIFWLLSISFSFVILGVIAFYYVSFTVKKNFENDIAFAVNISLAAINPDRVKNVSSLLPNDISQSEDFKRLKEQTIKLGKILASIGIDAIYVLNKIDENIYFLVESTPLGESGYVLPGALYEQPPKEVTDIFINHLSVNTPVYTDEYGTYISQFSPINNFSDNKFVGVLGVDIDYKHYQNILAKAHIATLIITSFLFLVAILLLFYFKNRQVANMEIKNNEKKITTIINTVHDGIVVTDNSGMIIFWNNACQNIFGYKSAQAINKKFDDLISFNKVIDVISDEQIKGFSLSGANNFLNQTFEIQISNAQKQELILELIISTAKLDKEVLIISLFKNITERKRKENEIGKMNKLMVGREIKMIELKEEIAALKNRLDSK